jgi:hypothetical protein
MSNLIWGKLWQYLRTSAAEFMVYLAPPPDEFVEGGKGRRQSRHVRNDQRAQADHQPFLTILHHAPPSEILSERRPFRVLHPY